MLSDENIYRIIGAAEGSWYNKVDKRYIFSMANHNSGLSVGVFQFDFATSDDGRRVLNKLLKISVCHKTESADFLKSLEQKAKLRNPEKVLNQVQLAFLQELLECQAARSIIDQESKTYLSKIREKINAIILEGIRHWTAVLLPTDRKMSILTEGTREHLHLFAYLMASYNRYPANREVFIKWLTGEKAITANGPAGGWQLEAPPTLYDMHTFLKSLRIWDGTQGKYEHLRSRLDPVLQTIAG